MAQGRPQKSFLIHHPESPAEALVQLVLMLAGLATIVFNAVRWDWF